MRNTRPAHLSWERLNIVWMLSISVIKSIYVSGSLYCQLTCMQKFSEVPHMKWIQLLGMPAAHHPGLAGIQQKGQNNCRYTFAFGLHADATSFPHPVSVSTEGWASPPCYHVRDRFVEVSTSWQICSPLWAFLHGWLCWAQCRKLQMLVIAWL